MFTSGNGQSSRRLKLSVEARIVVRFHGLVEEPCATRNAHKFDRPLPMQRGFDRSSGPFHRPDASNRSDALAEIGGKLERISLRLARARLPCNWPRPASKSHED